jgi:hypothetical protein
MDLMGTWEKGYIVLLRERGSERSNIDKNKIRKIVMNNAKKGVQYKVDDITYSVSKNIEKKLESVLDFDYTLTSYTSSSYKYAVVYNCYPPYYYDTSSGTFYY